MRSPLDHRNFVNYDWQERITEGGQARFQRRTTGRMNFKGSGCEYQRKLSLLSLAMKQLKIIDDTYEFIRWAVPKVNKFPRDHKFLLGDEIIRSLYRVLRHLITARYSREKRGLLQKTNIDLECLRHFFRLAYDFRLLNLSSYELASAKLDEIIFQVFSGVFFTVKVAKKEFLKHNQ